MEEKLNFAWPITSINKQGMDTFLRYVNDNEEMLCCKKIAIFGAGIKGNEYALFLQGMGYQKFVFIDNNEEKQNGYIEDAPILSLDNFLNNNENCFIFVAVESAEGIILQLKQHGLTEGRDFVHFKPEIYENFMKEYRRPYSNKYLFFGDCEFSSISIKDTNRDNLVEMIQKECGADQAKVLAMHGMGIRAFYHILQGQIKKDMKPAKVIMEVNLLTFTKTRHLLPRSQHVELLKAVCEETPFEELKEYVEEIKKRFNNYVTDFYVNNVKKREESQNKESLKIYIKLNYMYRFNENVEGVVYLRNMIRLCEKECIELGLFIPPVNYKLAEMFFGDSFWEKYNSIREEVIRIIQQEGIEPKDYSTKLEQSEFCTEETPDETANYNGRMVILQAINDDFIEDIH